MPSFGFIKQYLITRLNAWRRTVVSWYGSIKKYLATLMNGIKKYLANRMNGWAVAALVLCAIALWMFGEQIWTRLIIMGAMLAKLFGAGAFGYWFSKAIFRDIRPTNLTTQRGLHYMYCRAIVVAGAMIGGGFTV